MYASAALKQYHSVNISAQVAEASPHRLIQMLMEGGLSKLAQARGAMERGQLGLKGELIGHAISIIGGLREGLDLAQGGDVASNLDRLYEYMVARLLEANQKDSLEMLDEVAGMLREIKSSWDAIA
ncbi:MAG: flagellar export chaperone FliS [Pseudomonadaceae bacterium]|nr:flagellar export chaperone FliS [Pseudomonadaceae bacterium]